MGYTKAQVAELQKRVFIRRSIIAITFFIIIFLILMPNTIALYLCFTDKIDFFHTIIWIYIWPLIPPFLFCSYHTGLAVSTFSYAKWHKGLLASFCILVTLQIICTILTVEIEILLKGYPMQMGADTSQEVGLVDAAIFYLLFSIVPFMPAYYALYRYEKNHSTKHKQHKKRGKK